MGAERDAGVEPVSYGRRVQWLHRTEVSKPAQPGSTQRMGVHFLESAHRAHSESPAQPTRAGDRRRRAGARLQWAYGVSILVTCFVQLGLAAKDADVAGAKLRLGHSLAEMVRTWRRCHAR